MWSSEIYSTGALPQPKATQISAGAGSHRLGGWPLITRYFGVALVAFGASTAVASRGAHRRSQPRTTRSLTMNPLFNTLIQAPSRRSTERPQTASRLDRAIQGLLRRSASVPSSPATKVWASLKLFAVISASPVLGPGLFATLPLETARCRRRARRMPQALRTDDPDVVGASTRLDPAGRYVVTSDLHRCIPGGRDWPRQQATDDLYRVALDHYGAEGWGLIEAGDIEDFWMVGGSALGVTLDALRMLGAALWPIDRRLSHATARNQLQRIIDNYEATYSAIAEKFVGPGRYWRLSGNHDDPLIRPEVAPQLARHLPELVVHDLVSLGDPGQIPEAVITHGHLTDPWNSPNGAWRGRFVTWLASALADLTGDEPGLTGATARTALLAGRAGNRLRSIRGPFSVDRDQFTLNETELHEAFAGHFGENAGPWLVLGHTHVPGDGPWDPGTNSRYERYVNSGSGVAERVITAVEWDGSAAERRPILVAIARESDLDPAGAGPEQTDPAHRIALRAGERTTIGSLDGEAVVRVVLRAPATVPPLSAVFAG